MKSLAQLVANITKTAGASGIQFIITLAVTPIMTRLYEPTAYATFGIINTTATVLVGIGLLTLPSAYTSQKRPEIRSEMVLTMLVLLIGLVGLAALGALGMWAADIAHEGMDIPLIGLIFLPVLVLTYGIRQILVNVTIQRGNFNRLSLGQLVEPICSRGGSIALGAGFGGHPTFILLSVAFGHLSTIALSAYAVPKGIFKRWREVLHHISSVRATLRHFGDFVVFGTAAQQAQQVAMLGMQMGIAAFFSAHLAGEYILAVSILTLPVSLVALATAPVVYHHFITIEKTSPEHLLRHFMYASALYVLVGLIILMPVYFYGEIIFRFAFGEVWAHAGAIAAKLSIAYVGMFALTGVQSILMVTRRLRMQFLWEVGTCVPALLAAILCFKTMAFDGAIIYLSLIWLLRNFVLLCVSMAAAYQHSHRRALMNHD